MKIKKKYKIALGIGALVFIIVAGLLISPFFINKELNESFSKNNSNILKFSGVFEKIDYKVKGSFKVYQMNDKNILRIENLDITSGPDLYLVLSNKKPSFGNSDYQIIEKLKANIGSFNVELKDNIDFTKYKYLIIHCKTFSHSFAGAEITPAN